MPIYQLENNKLIRVEGPALIKVLSGTIYALGVNYKEGDRLTVLRARRIVIRAVERSSLDITLGPSGSVEEVHDGEEVVQLWDDVLSKLKLENSVITVLGAMDVGKTTLTLMIANKLSAKGLKVGIIDSDVGQNDLGPSSTVNAAVLEPGKTITHLSLLSPVRSIFLKTTSVERIWTDVVDATSRLVDYLRSAEHVSSVIINTDGWISTDDAVKYKLSLIKRTGTSIALVIKRGDEADKLVSALSEHQVNHIVLPAPPNTRARTRADRRIHREMSYGRYLMPVRELSIDLKSVPIANLPICTGAALSDHVLQLLKRLVGSEIVHGEQIRDKAIVVCNSKDYRVINAPGGIKIAVLPAGWETGLLAALEDESNYLLALCVIKKIYYNSKKIVVLTSKNFNALNKVHHIRAGMIRLNKNFEEVEKVHGLSKLEHLFLSSVT